MIVYIDRQHAGKPSKINDRGAGADLDGDGIIEAQEREAILTGFISMHLETKLINSGIKVIPLSDGSYSERHKRVNEYAARYPNEAQIYLALHLNAGGGNYSSFFYHPSSTKGKQLAEMLCHEMLVHCPAIPKQLSIAAESDGWTKNAYYTIRGVGRPVAICCEPLFMDNPDHQQYLSDDGCQDLANAIASAIITYGEANA